MIQAVIAVVSLFQQVSEFNGLVGLIVMHGSQIKGGDSKEKSTTEDRQEKPCKGLFIHFEDVPKTSTST